jgi:DNA polymerase III alpha subunit
MDFLGLRNLTILDDAMRQRADPTVPTSRSTSTRCLKDP